MITYSTNWMGPISTNWYKERGLLRTVSRKSMEEGDVSEIVDYEVTTSYCGGRIDIRDSSKYGYDGWDEYSLSPMHREDWNALSAFLDDLVTDEQLSYDELIERFELSYGKKIRWATNGHF